MFSDDNSLETAMVSNDNSLQTVMVRDEVPLRRKVEGDTEHKFIYV